MSVVGFIEKLCSRCQFSPHTGLVIKLRLLSTFSGGIICFVCFKGRGTGLLFPELHLGFQHGQFVLFPKQA